MAKIMREMEGQPGLSKCEKLITGNVKHFQRFEGITVEDWRK